MNQTEINQLKDYVLLMQGAPVIEVDLNEKELDFCVEKPISIIQERELINAINHDVLIKLLQTGANAIGQYIIAKKKFKKLDSQYLLTPEEDGFADMTQADSDWNEFIGKIKYYSYSLSKKDAS